jgi:hypothetical protein
MGYSIKDKPPNKSKPHTRTHHVVTNVIHCCYYNVNFVLFHDVIYCTIPLLSCIHVNTANFFYIMCTLIATSVILGRLGCNCHET